MLDAYTDYMTKMKGILKKPLKDFCCVEQMLMYNIISPRDFVGREYVKGISQSAYDSYTKSGKGHRSIKGMVSKITILSSADLADFLSDINNEEYDEYEFDGNLEYNIQASFGKDLDGLGAYNTFDACAILLERICFSEMGKKRKSAKKTEDNASDTSVSNTLNKTDEHPESYSASTKTNEEKRIVLPDIQPSDIFPYSLEDRPLLEEFTGDYDEIMVTLIGENYASSLLDMTLLRKTEDLYKSKWKSKADTFTDPTLKAYVFGLLGELNNLNACFVSEAPERFTLRAIRIKIRNLYTKLNPDLFDASFPYEAFIDDWNDGEF